MTAAIVPPTTKGEIEMGLKEQLEKTMKAMEEGYAGFLPGGVVVDVREYPEARPAPGMEGRNSAEYLKKMK